MSTRVPKPLSELEAEIWQVVCDHDSCTADDVRRALERRRPLKDSTVRTVLRRLEAKGYVAHSVEGRTYVYRRVVAPQGAAARAVLQIVDRLCGGSVESLLAGMLDARMVSREQLERLARRVDAAEREEK